MARPGQHQRRSKATGGDQFGRGAIAFTPKQIAEINALAEQGNRSFSATVAYLVEHALRTKRPAPMKHHDGESIA